MAKTKDDQMKFIELRAKGYSFDKISKEIDVSKPTLVKWSNDLAKDIENYSFIETESLLEQYKINRRQKIEFMCEEIQKAQNELKKRDYSKVTTKDLIKVIQMLEDKINYYKDSEKYHTGEMDSGFFGITDEILLKLN